METLVRSLFTSKFFDVPEVLNHDQLTRYCQLWERLQFEFTLGVGQLNGKLFEKLKEMLRTNPRNQDELCQVEVMRKLLILQTPAVVDELGIGRQKSLMHDLLFMQQVTDSGVTFEILSRKEMPADLQTLYDAIQKAFDGKILDGLCMAIVVELMAPQLFDAQYRIFSNAGISDELLMHSKIHRSLEIEHAHEAYDMGECAITLFGEQKVEEQMNLYVHLWNNFFAYIVKNIYESKNCS